MGDDVFGLAHVKRLVDVPREVFELGPEGLAVAEIAQLAALVELAGNVGDLCHETEVSLLRRRTGVGTLEDFDQTERFKVGADLSEQNEKVSRVSRTVFRLAAGVRHGDRLVLFGPEELIQEAAVLLVRLFVFVQMGLLNVDLVRERQLPCGVDRPDCAGFGGQGDHNAREKLFMEILGRDIGLRDFGNLADQRADLLFCLFDKTRIDSWIW